MTDMSARLVELRLGEDCSEHEAYVKEHRVSYCFLRPMRLKPTPAYEQFLALLQRSRAIFHWNIVEQQGDPRQSEICAVRKDGWRLVRDRDDWTLRLTRDPADTGSGVNYCPLTAAASILREENPTCPLTGRSWPDRWSPVVLAADAWWSGTVLGLRSDEIHRLTLVSSVKIPGKSWSAIRRDIIKAVGLAGVKPTTLRAVDYSMLRHEPPQPMFKHEQWANGEARRVASCPAPIGPDWPLEVTSRIVSVELWRPYPPRRAGGKPRLLPLCPRDDEFRAFDKGDELIAKTRRP